MNTIRTLTVYLGSSGRTRPVFREAAETLGRGLAAGGLALVYGGMDAGLMGLLARTALGGGARVTGIVPERLKDSERMLEGLDETIMVDDLWDRKKRMFLRADAVVALPGGYGTVDEALEVLYWGRLGLHDKPLVFVDVDGYWTDFLAYLKTLPDFDSRFCLRVARPEDVIPALQAWSSPVSPIAEPSHFPHFEDEITRETDEPIIVDRASVENIYYLVCALGLKQLARTRRPIGILNRAGQFDGLLAWFDKALKERFITEHCPLLYDVAADEDALHEVLKTQEMVEIDLHAEKWGARE